MRLVTTLTRRLCSVAPLRGSVRPPGQLWRPAAFTLLVGGVSYSASGVYAVELKRWWSKSVQWARDGQNNAIKEIRRWWFNVGPANRFTFSIIAANLSVFLLWRVPAMHHIMEKYFLSSTTNKSSLSLLLSGFSHMEVWHLTLNMIVLWSFAPTLLCTFASMVGYYAKLLRGSPLPSLGASGALMAVVTLVVFNHPGSHVYLIFLPFIPIPSSWALGGVVAMDAMGLIRGWKFFDHAGHLGGVLFAVLFQYLLHPVLGRLQRVSAGMWHNIRNKRRES